MQRPFQFVARRAALRCYISADGRGGGNLLRGDSRSGPPVSVLRRLGLDLKRAKGPRRSEMHRGDASAVRPDTFEPRGNGDIYPDSDDLAAGDVSRCADLLSASTDPLHHCRADLARRQGPPLSGLRHRIHHGVDSAYHNKNFADALPIFDILFGTYHHTGRGEFPRTGLGREFPAPKSLWSVQLGPLAAITRMLLRQRRARVKAPSRA